MCDEPVYQADFAARLASSGIEVEREVPVTVSHDSFSKTYYLDIVVSGKAIYEFKTVSQLVGKHTAQLLNYLLLTNSSRGKLVNFRPDRIESQFVNAPITHEKRMQVTVAEDRLSPSGTKLREVVLSLLNDWGMFLDLGLYRQAIIDLMGGEDEVVKQMPASRGDIALGNQKMLMIADRSAFQISGFKGNLSHQEAHFRRVLELTDVDEIHWINLCRNDVSFRTVRR